MKDTKVRASVRRFPFKETGRSRGQWENYKRLRDKEPGRVRTIIEIDNDLELDVHTDINLYDFTNQKMWKGDFT